MTEAHALSARLGKGSTDEERDILSGCPVSRASPGPALPRAAVPGLAWRRLALNLKHI